MGFEEKSQSTREREDDYSSSAKISERAAT
jgi:hypothetical protein